MFIVEQPVKALETGGSDAPTRAGRVVSKPMARWFKPDDFLNSQPTTTLQDSP
jgi:hypothetical protein